MGRPVTRQREPAGANTIVPGKNRTGTESEIWLARLFLLALTGAGLASLLFHISPEKLAWYPCPFHSITGVECPGCGMTRACIALARGDIGNALNYNPLSLGLVLLAGGFALAPHRIHRYWRRLPLNIRTLTGWSTFVLILGFWVHRILIN